MGIFENMVKIVETNNIPGFEENNLEDNSDSCTMIIDIRTGDKGMTEQRNYILGFVLVSAFMVVLIGGKIYIGKKDE